MARTRRTQTPTSTTQAVLYLRVSTTEQAQEGISLEAQEARLRAYCALRGFEVVEVVCDAGVSAGKSLESRAGGWRILELVQHGKVAHVVAYKLDRLFRDCADCLTVTKGWDKAGIALHLVDLGGQTLDTSSAMGRFFLTVMAGAAELERNLVAERTTDAMAHKREKNERISRHVPYGKMLADDNRSLVDNPTEQAVIAIARELYSAGLSSRKVAQRLAERGLYSRAGTVFTSSAIFAMVA